jgi:hypothetical protein
LTSITPRAIGGTSWRLTFSPLGQNVPLFSSRRPELGESRMAAELNVDAPIRAAAFHEDLETASTAYYGDPVAGEGSLVVFANGLPVPASKIECANLDGWSTLAQPTDDVVRLDVTRGRLIVPSGLAGQAITVSHFYGFSAPMGGGEYNRKKWLVPSPSLGGGGAASTMPSRPRTSVPRTANLITDDATDDP